MPGMSATAALLDWYAREARDLPWRRRPTPYRVWISEVMLQQTTVATAGPYFLRFVAKYPTVRSLAAAREADVLALWSGLGYYHRARNLLAAARLMVRRHHGRVPADLAALRALPGVGSYTAGAILSIGHGIPAAALDGNVMRVAARLAGIDGDPGRAATRRAVEGHVMDLMPPADASRFNQALMDLGATICSPREPECLCCPVSAWCAARRDGSVARIPPPAARSSTVPVELAALVVKRGARVLLMTRGKGPLMKGLWEFPLVPGASLPEVRKEAGRLGARVTGRAGLVRHVITRHRLSVTVYEARPSGPGGAPAKPHGTSARGTRLSEASAAALRLATPEAGRAGARRWACLADLTAGGARGVPLTGTARKITRLLAAAR